ncbi:sperm acrosome membrane-associated protein 6 [Orycteropus afer afer]|uniref:Sperm acrosome membrane-associated protein 6 n=1 Tax=Orycteropus afer afer TaxID=1230840 RepID=A0AC54ZDC9_ORYAF|nr:sperm acrosome membrane-associated protein 6 [Orycteropus afer afer]
MALLAPVMALSALGALAAVTAPVGACLLCFTTYSERLRVCQLFVGIEGPALQKCEDAFTAAFQGLRDTEINYDERSHLHDIFTQVTHLLQETAATHRIQERSRRFRCRGCYSTLCGLPLDCPIQDMEVIRGDQAMFSCEVNFELPEEITYSWKFVGGGVSRGGASGKLAKRLDEVRHHRAVLCSEIPR